jgi:sugar/nucleoside kinase (ribokinase family)
VSDEALLLGPLSHDRYVPDGPVLPGGGVLNMAWHWRQLGTPFRLLSRIGDDDPDPFLAVLDRLDVVADRTALVQPGATASIDVAIQPDRQPWMDHFVEGVWADYALGADELTWLTPGRRLHAVLVEGAIAELSRLAGIGALDGVEVSADFLGFRHYTVERLASTMRHVALGFIGWPGDEDDPAVAGMREVAHDLGRLVVVTLGSRGVLVFDGRAGGTGDRRFPVEAVPVAGTTVGCGDAFVAHFLATWWTTGDVAAAVEAGKAGGAMATRWVRPLPDEVYGPLVASQ